MCLSQPLAKRLDYLVQQLHWKVPKLECLGGLNFFKPELPDLAGSGKGPCELRSLYSAVFEKRITSDHGGYISSPRRLRSTQ